MGWESPGAGVAAIADAAEAIEKQASSRKARTGRRDDGRILGSFRRRASRQRQLLIYLLQA
jgi:hypothetical protein